MRYVARIFLILVLFFLATSAHEPFAGDEKKPVSALENGVIEKKSAPDFLLKDLDGRGFSLASRRGRVVLLNFWATWCPSCVAEMPSLARLYHDMKSRDLQIIAISTDRSAQDVKSYLNKQPLDFPVLIDENRSVTRQYRVFSLPTTFLIDKNGIIVDRFFGEYDWTDREIKAKIQRLF